MGSENGTDSERAAPSLINGLLRNFDRHEQERWFRENWTISLYFVIGYLIFIYKGQDYMKDRKPYELKRVMILWNSALAIFSITACMAILPEFMSHLSAPNGFHGTCCNSVTRVSDRSLYWGWLFTLSKIAELGDTVFLILRKRQLIFLHWYHHITVLLFCWYSYADQISTGPWFICVNYSIHALMYTYYSLRSVGVRIPRWIAMTITSLQLSQMVIGVIVNVHAYRMLQQNVECDVSMHHLQMGLGMYASYFFLFAHFFHKAYLHRDEFFKHGKITFTSNNNNNNYSNLKTNVNSKAKLLKSN